MVGKTGRRRWHAKIGAMVIPNLQINISASVVAIYAALMSTIVGAVQLSNFLRDRARIKISVRRNMEIIGAGHHRTGLTIVEVVNSGRRPVTITTVGARRRYPLNHFVIPECNPRLPHELTEGKSLIAIIPPCDLDFSTIEDWEACDAIGRSHRFHVAPWRSRMMSNLRWRRQWRQERASAAEKSA